MTIGVAIIGGGIFAREEHKPAVEASPHLTLRAVYSRSLKSAQTLGTDPSSVDLYSDDSGPGKSLDSLLQRADIGAVIIALPIKNQPAYIRQCLLAGKHVLSEKPIAENVAEAVELIHWYRSTILSSTTTGGVTWSVAENQRYLASFQHAASEVQKKGRQLSFRLRMNAMIEGGKYFETEWRKMPTHQGGFLLDGGVHFTAGLRLLLGKENPLVSISAYSAQLQPHLPPVDTLEGTACAKNGAVGTLSISFGTTYKGHEYTVAAEKGYVSIKERGHVTVDGTTEEVKDEKSGVPPEVRAWGEAISQGKANPEQSPEEALADLELIEAMLRSGELGGVPVHLKYQTPHANVL